MEPLLKGNEHYDANRPALLWTEDDVKVLFQKYRMWPTFLGAKFDEERKIKKSAFPVFIWPEQRPILERPITLSSLSSNDGAIKKRKRFDSFQEDSGSFSKRQKSASLLSSVSGIISGVAAYVLAWWGRNKKSESKEDVIRTPVLNEDHAYSIYEDLRKRGYFVGPGDAYGGEYTIYKGGDPSSTHSMGTIRVARNGREGVPTIAARDLLAFSRVQNQVAKNSVVAFIDPNKHMPEYLIINFRDVSER